MAGYADSVHLRLSPVLLRMRMWRAFTLVELLTVLLILGLMGAVAAPRYANALARQRVEAAVRRIGVDLSAAQRQAKHTGSSCTITFEPASNAYSVSNAQDPDHPGSNYLVQLGREPYGADIVSADFGGDAELTFDGFGAPDTGGTVTIRVGSRQRTVTIDGNHGSLNLIRLLESPIIQ